ncbi:hypothetical protein QFC21_002456 [Naganishia friedmannii]|uniref:Uncharacterized protein n=1 Tax=Naganishia friedmannii TaxID=89922 RepID=A0ACC2VXT4_9TREE|nr:hypothetical protein QFC21_002456 [Naganishia friedmannii]
MADLRSLGRPTKLPAVYHPTISEYYRLSLRLEDYIRCLVVEQDWPAVFDPRPSLTGEADTYQSYKELLSGVLVSFSEAQVAPVEESWKNATGRCVGLQLQSQTDRGGEGKTPYTGLSRDRPGLSRQNVNDCERILQSSGSWIELHRRIGTDLMIHLLTETTIFIPQLNNCFLQLLGPPMDGLTTLVKMSAESRLREAADRKRKLTEEKGQSRKKKSKVGDKSLPSDHIANEPLLAAPDRAVAKQNSKNLSRHTSSSSIFGTRFDIHEEARAVLRYIFPREHNLENVWNWRKQEDRYTKTIMPEYRDWSNREEELLVRRVLAGRRKGREL